MHFFTVFLTFEVFDFWLVPKTSTNVFEHWFMDNPLLHLEQSYHLHCQSYRDEKPHLYLFYTNDLASLGGRWEIWELYTSNSKMFAARPAPLISFFNPFLLYLACISKTDTSSSKFLSRGSSRVVKWLLFHLPMQGVWVLSLAGQLKSHMPQG